MFSLFAAFQSFERLEESLALYWILSPHHLSPPAPFSSGLDRASRSRILFCPGWVCWHTVSLGFSFTTDILFLTPPPIQKGRNWSFLTSKVATAVDCISIHCEGGVVVVGALNILQPLPFVRKQAVLKCVRFSQSEGGWTQKEHCTDFMMEA